MKQKINKLLAISTLMTSFTAMTNNHAAIHNISDDSAHTLIQSSKAWSDNGMGDEGMFGTFWVSGQYRASFKNAKSNGLGSLFSFGGSETNEMTIGAGTTAGKDFNIDGYQLGLGNTATASTLKMKLSPKVYQAGADFGLLVGANKYNTGFYVRANGAVGVASVDPQLTTEGKYTAGAYAQGAFKSGETIAAADVHADLKTAFAGKDLGDNWKALKYGKIDGKKTTGAKFGDFEVALGYNFLADDDKTVGVGLCATIPTANKSKGEYVFEPIFGNNGHWALGGEVFVRANLYTSDEGDKSLTFWMNGHASHLFKAQQVRTFDAKANEAGSRYMLVGRYNGSTTATVTNSATSAAQFQNEVGALANYSTLACDTKISVKGAAAAMLDYNCNNWNLGVGASFWGSAKENITITGTLADVAILGRQLVYNNATANGYSQPKATMNSQIAQYTTVDTETDDIKFAGLTTSLVGTDGLDAASAANKARYTAKVFANAGYKWTDSDYCPSLSVTGSAEFGVSKHNTVNMWGVAVQGGICF